MENGFGRNLRAIQIETKQYNKEGKEVNSTTRRAEYLKDGQEYVSEEYIQLKDKVTKVEVKIYINETLDNQDTGPLYNDQFSSSAWIDSGLYAIVYKIENKAYVDIKDDFEAILVFYKEEIPIHVAYTESKEIRSKEVQGGIRDYVDMPFVVTVKDGLKELEFDRVKVVVNRAREMDELY